VAEKYKQSEGNIHSLVSSSSKKGNRTARIQSEVSGTIQQAIEEIYLNPNQASAKDTHDYLRYATRTSNCLNCRREPTPEKSQLTGAENPQLHDYSACRQSLSTKGKG
jgi:hypothetical protein